MSDYNDKTAKCVLLLPHEIKISRRYNVRLYRANDEPTKAEQLLVAHLASSLEHSGQLDDLIIAPDYSLIAGHRRRQAAMLINERRDSNFLPLFRLRCRIDTSGGDLRLKAISSNFQRSAHSPMDLCYLLHTIREEKGWAGPSHTRELAKYLSMDDSTVNSLENLMRLEKELQNMLHEGVISMKTCQDLRKAVPAHDDRLAVIARATEIQQEDTLDKAISDYNSGRKSLTETTRSLQSAPRIRIQHPSVMKAIREQVGDPANTKLPLSRQDLISSIAQLDSSSYGLELREFARYWSKEYSQGQGTLADLIDKAKAIG